MKFDDGKIKISGERKYYIDSKHKKKRRAMLHDEEIVGLRTFQRMPT